MAGAAIFALATTLIMTPILWACGMPFTEVLADRAINLLLIGASGSQQERLRRWSNLVLDGLHGTRRYQVLRPILGIGGIFTVQTVIYTTIMLVYRASNLGLAIGLASLFGGSIAQWVWGEKWRWVLLRYQWGSRRVNARIERLRRTIWRGAH